MPHPASDDLASQASAVCLCFHTRKAARAITQVFDHALAPSGLKATQLNLLMAIRASEPLRIGALADAMVTDSTTLSRTLRPLERSGLLKTEALKDDRRVKTVVLTPEGRRTLDAALPLWQDAQKRVVSGLGNSAVQSLLPVLEAAARLGPAKRD